MNNRKLQKLDTSFRRVYREEALKQQHFECRYCFEPLTYKSVTADHFEPKSKGGLDRKENIVPCCLSCNRMKGSMTANQYMNRIKHFPKGEPIEWLIKWSNRRVNLAASRSVKRISEMFGVSA